MSLASGLKNSARHLRPGLKKSHHKAVSDQTHGQAFDVKGFVRVHHDDGVVGVFRQ
jgi:hypothetical protein